MFLTNKQTIVLSALVAACFFMAGALDILNNLMVIIVLLVGFLALIINLILAIKSKKNPE